MIISFIIQLLLTAIFWVCGLVDYVVVPVFWRGYEPFRFSKWLLNHHQAFVWTQLIFSLALVLAGLVRRQQRDEFLGVFESASISTSITLTGAALILSTISYHATSVVPPVRGEQRMRREKHTFGERVMLFIVTYTATLVIGAVLVLMPLWAARTENILDVCYQFAYDTNKPWKDGAISSMRKDISIFWGLLIATLAAILIALAVWYLLRNRTWSNESAIRRGLLLTLAIPLSGFLMYMGVDAMLMLVQMRDKMGILWDFQNGQDILAIGQVLAIFTWAPLFGDIACLGAMRMFRTWKRDPRPRPASVEESERELENFADSDVV